MIPRLALRFVAAVAVFSTAWCAVGSTPASSGAAVSGEPNSADRLILWTSCSDLINASDADLAEWARRGAGGFVCMTGYLGGVGGDQRFSARPEGGPGESYRLQAELHAADLAERMRRHDMVVYLGFYLTNVRNTRTPLAEWYDDDAWTERVLPAVRGLSSAARSLGFAGIALDEELYPQVNGKATATWDWAYRGNTRTEQDVRAQVRLRGRQMMQAIVDGFPSVRVLDYGTQFPNTWSDVVQESVNGIKDAAARSTQIDFWDGMTSVTGYESIQFLNALFYKTFHVGPSWDNAYSYEYNSFFALLSRRFANWSYAADRVSQSPFVWISSGSARFEAARSPEHVAEQLAAARRWGMDRQLGVYDSFAQGFDYRPYLSAIESASRPGVVATRPPTLVVDRGARTGARADRVTVTGRATDPFALRYIRWSTEDGHTGTARLRWVVDRGDARTGFEGHTEWTAKVPVRPGTNRVTITAENIKGLRTTLVQEVVVK